MSGDAADSAASPTLPGAQDGYCIGIDPGDRYIGLAIARIVGNEATPIFLETIDLGQGQGAYRSLLAGRARHRRTRRTVKALKTRMAGVRRVLGEYSLPEEQARRAVALCRRRGWAYDAGLARSEAPEDGEGDAGEPGEDHWTASLRLPREQVLGDLRGLVATAAPALPTEGVERVLAVLRKPPRAKGLNNRKVGLCGHEGCRRRRCVAREYAPLWLAGKLLRTLQSPRRETHRQAFLQSLVVAGWPVARDQAPRFRTGTGQRREAALKAVRKAWSAAKAAGELPQPVLDDAERFLRGVKARIASGAASRSRYCPEHLHEEVKVLARAENPPQALSGRAGHSLLWEAVAAKVASHLQRDVLPTLPPGARIDRISVERAAFDLVRVENPRRRAAGKPAPRRPVSDEARWLGPYGQLRALMRADGHVGVPTVRQALAFETGGLCALCGDPLGGTVDMAHLVPQAKVGGYPYLAVVAAHPLCNQRAGSRVSIVAPQAVDALHGVRERILRRGLHRWMDQKYGILHALAAASGDPERTVQVEALLRRAFAAREATMQGADALGEAVRGAVVAAGRGTPQVCRRGAGEVAGARWVATCASDEDEPWYCKDEAKALGDTANHAMDAFVVAALPPAEPLPARRGDVQWAVRPGRVRERFAVLATEEAWTQAAGAAPEGVPVLSLTLRRVWRQAYAKDTLMRRAERRGVAGAYRVSAGKWLDDLRKSLAKGSGRGHVENLQLEPLRRTALAALDAPDPYTAVRDAVVAFLKASTLAGLHGGQAAPTAGHPVREARIQALRAWASGPDQEVPPWVGITVREDRRIGAKGLALPARQGEHTLESWAASVGVVAQRGDGTSAFFWVSPLGGLEPAEGGGAPLGDAALLATVHPHKVTALGPASPRWREAAARVLCAAGFVAAWVVGPGSVLVGQDGTEVRVSSKKDMRTAAVKKALVTVAGVRRGVRLRTLANA